MATLLTRRQQLKEVLPLAKTTDQVLSLYLSSDRHTIFGHASRPGLSAQNATKERAKRLLDGAREHLPQSLQGPFDQARRPLEVFLADIEAMERDLAEQGLGMFGNVEGRLLASTYLPALPVRDSVRFGPGADLLPALDVLDKLEPIVACLVERNKATVLVIEAGEIVYRKHIASEVPQKSRATSRDAQWSAPHYQRHQDAHVRRHLREVAELLQDTVRRQPTRRVLLAGPQEAISNFRLEARGPLLGLIRGTFSVPGYASDAAIRDAVLTAVVEVERQGEEELTQELVTRGMKDHRAVLGPAATAHALQREGVHQLVVAGDATMPGRRCPACEHVGAVEESRCSVCQAPTYTVDLGRELAVLSMRRNIPIEIVHGQAAEILGRHGGIGALLEFPSAT